MERARDACDVFVSAPAAPPFVVGVTMRCRGAAVSALEPDDARVLRFVEGKKDGARVLCERGSDGLSVASYRVDLSALAREVEHADAAYETGGSLVAATSSFVFTPIPERDGVPVRIWFDPVTGADTGIRLVNGAHLIESHELRVSTYTAFGKRQLRRFALEGKELRVVMLDGRTEASFDALSSWVADAARGVSQFFGRVPDEGQLVLLAPVPSAPDIPFGKLLPESGPGIVILVGEHAKERDLRRDWVLVHELFHVGTPSFLGEGKWFDEGLATYFEPLIRARLGWLDERDLWRDFARELPRGLKVIRGAGLENGADFSDVYWGGAIFCLLADLEVRKKTGGRLGLEDGVRRVLAQGGIASEVWTLARAFEVADKAFPEPVLAPLAARHATKPVELDLDAILAELGVARSEGKVALDESVPLSTRRRQLVFGATRPPAP